MYTILFQPIHIPGAVQAWGVLIAVEMIDGRFPVKQVSEVCIANLPVRMPLMSYLELWPSSGTATKFPLSAGMLHRRTGRGRSRSVP